MACHCRNTPHEYVQHSYTKLGTSGSICCSAVWRVVDHSRHRSLKWQGQTTSRIQYVHTTLKAVAGAEPGPSCHQETDCDSDSACQTKTNGKCVWHCQIGKHVSTPWMCENVQVRLNSASDSCDVMARIASLAITCFTMIRRRLSTGLLLIGTVQRSLYLRRQYQ